MTDCLVIGHNDGSFPDYVSLVRSMGSDSGAWRDLNLAFIEIDGVPHRSMDVLNRCNGRDGVGRRRLSNMDFLWPAVTYLASFLHRRGFSVDYVNQFQEERDLLRAKLQRGDVATVAITTTLYVGAWWIEDVVSFVRRHAPATKIILGGPFISNQSQLLPQPQFLNLLQQLDADIYVISQEGEQTLATVLGCLAENRSMAFVSNLAYRRGGKYIVTTPAPESNPLADNGIDYSLFPREQIGEFVTVRTSKSCPFSCAFCGFPQRAGKYKYEDVSIVERELDNIRAIGTVTTLTFIDDTFNVPMPRFKKIMRMMIRNRYGFRWNSFLRADHVDAECIELMRESGCEGVFLGVESGSDRMLKQMNKTSRAEHYRRVIPWLKQAGIITYCSLIIGFPGETSETLQETMSLIDDVQPDFYRAQLWYCDPATPVWTRRDELGIEGSAFSWRHPTMDASEAARIIDRLFLERRASMWLPQQGFELWSVFYLQRKGMSLTHLKSFLEAFNDAVRLKLRPSVETEADVRSRLFARATFASPAVATL